MVVLGFRAWGKKGNGEDGGRRAVQTTHEFAPGRGAAARGAAATSVAAPLSAASAQAAVPAEAQAAACRHTRSTPASSPPENLFQLTPMIGGNDVRDETFTLADTATVRRLG